jgi:hypothetical protein
MNMKILIPFLALMGSSLLYGQDEVKREPVVTPVKTPEIEEESLVRQEDESSLVLGAYREIDPANLAEEIKELIRSQEVEGGTDLTWKKAWTQMVAGQRFLVAYETISSNCITTIADDGVWTIEFEPVLAVAVVLQEPAEKLEIITTYRNVELFDLIQQLLLGERRQ